MAVISLTINGRTYDVTCDDGQEGHLRKLAEHIDERVRGLADSVGQVGESRLLVLAGLLLADELYEAYRQLHAADGSAGNGADAAAAVEDCAARVEAIAARLEQA